VRVIRSALIAACLGSAIWSQELPPQEGYRWERVPEVKAAVLVPVGWQFKVDKRGETVGYFVTRENVDETGKFETGLTVNVMRRPGAHDSEDYATVFLDGFAAGKTLLGTWEIHQGPFVGRGCRVEDEGSVLHTLAFANSKTNTFYLAIFEAPKAAWGDAWRIGERIVKMLYLDDEI
jgi:hypothetical protein